MNDDFKLSQPTYTISIPVYNRVYGFKESLDSALSVKECTEILIVDDNSDTNDFEIICKSYNDNRIRYFKNHINLGLFGNWNKGIELAKGDYISILCSDDLINSDIYKLFLEAYSEHLDLDIFFGNFVTFSNSINDSVVHRSFRSGLISALELYTDAINNGPCFPVLSVIKRDKAIQYPFVSKPHSGNDWLWIYTNAHHLKLYASSQTLNYWRRHPNQDAVLSQSVTMDCWPLMFMNISQYLSSKNNWLAGKARRRAKAVILTFLLNDQKNKQENWINRIKKEKNDNYFIKTIYQIVENDLLLKKMLYKSKISPFYYFLGRLIRKIKYYPS
jgi:glycosyltransferase involved in cell wall biosynthesis